MDRNAVEQQALAHLNRGDMEAALRSYLSILKFDPKDLRIRQKVGDLFARTGRTNEAERAWRDLYEALVAGQSHRQAVSILKQLVALKPDEARYHFDLGECYVASGYANDARQHYEAALRIDGAAGRPMDAAKAARRLAEIAPGDVSARLKVAELLDAGGDKHGAAKSYNEVMDELRRRGRPDEVGRVAELALRVTPEDPGLMLDAASARIEAGDYKRALAHLQVAYPLVPKEPRTLDLLARAFEAQAQGEKALKVLGELVKVGRERGDVGIEADALRRSARLAPEDADLAARLGEAEERLSRRERRLTTLILSTPGTEEELRAVVRGEVYARYGYFDRAQAALQAGLEQRADSPALLASMAELLASAGRTEDALRWMQRLLPLAAGESDAVLDRMAVLKGGPPVEAAAAVPSGSPTPAPSASPAPAASTASPSTASPSGAPTAPSAAGEEARGDALAASGDVQGAVLAWRNVLAVDPMNAGVLAKLAALRPAARPAAPVEGTFAEVSPEDLSDADLSMMEELPPEDDLDDDAHGAALFGDAPATADDASVIEEARSLVAIGLHQEAIALVTSLPSLEARVVEALAYRGLQDASRAVDVLRAATNDVAESDPAYAEALFELSGLYTETGKHRAALRLAEELLDLHPDFRPTDVRARLRGLQRLVGSTR